MVVRGHTPSVVWQKEKRIITLNSLAFLDEILAAICLRPRSLWRFWRVPDCS